MTVIVIFLKVVFVGEELNLFSLSSGHYYVPVVLHGVVSAAGKKPGYESPFVAVDAMSSEESLFFFFGKWSSVDSWV